MSDTNLTIKGSFPLVTIKEGETFIVLYPLLDNISSYGNSYEETLKFFNEALVGTLMILQEEGTLEEFLTSCGWSIEKEVKNTYIVPPFVVQTENYTPEKLQENADFTSLRHKAVC